MTPSDRVKYRVARSAEIAAPAQAVWDRIVAVESWPEWKPFISRTVMSGPRRLGPQLNFKLNCGMVSALHFTLYIFE